MKREAIKTLFLGSTWAVYEKIALFIHLMLSRLRCGGSGAPKSHEISLKGRLVLENKAALEFFTCRTTAPITMLQHFDQYSAGEHQA